MSHPVTVSSTSLVQRLIDFRNRHGIAGTIHKSIDAVVHRVFRAAVHEVVWLDVESLTEMAPPDSRFTFRFLTADELAGFAHDPCYYIDPALGGSVRSGHVLCFAALAGPRLAAFGCYMLESVPAEHAGGVAMSLPSDVAYMFSGFTHPDFRGARLHGLVMGLALQELAQHGITKLVSIVEWTNGASLKSCHRLGYVGLGKMITVGGRKRAVGLYPKRAKQRGVQFGRRADPKRHNRQKHRRVRCGLNRPR